MRNPFESTISGTELDLDLVLSDDQRDHDDQRLGDRHRDHRACHAMWLEAGDQGTDDPDAEHPAVGHGCSAVPEADDHEAEELTCDGPAAARLRAARGSVFAGGRRAGLSHATVAKPADAVLNTAAWQGRAPPPLDPPVFRAGIGAAERGGPSPERRPRSPPRLSRIDRAGNVVHSDAPFRFDSQGARTGPCGSVGREVVTRSDRAARKGPAVDPVAR